jgi:hypothetical protein
VQTQLTEIASQMPSVNQWPRASIAVAVCISANRLLAVFYGRGFVQGSNALLDQPHTVAAPQLSTRLSTKSVDKLKARSDGDVRYISPDESQGYQPYILASDHIT